MKELVLPSGKFARMRAILAIDILISFKAEFPEAALISRVITLDDSPIPYAEVLTMEGQEFSPLLGMVGEVIKSFKLKGIA